MQFIVFTGLLLVTASPVLAQTTQSLEAIQETLQSQQNTMNHMWTMLAAALVAFMQGGFLLLEAGMVRSKNSINVAQKNITDFIVSILCFYFIGFMVMFGSSSFGLFGWDLAMMAVDEMSDWSYTFFVFQAVFVGTAATILSGAVAERMKFSSYIIMAIILSCLIYPVFGHWAWGNLLMDNTTFLIEGGFIDFAGSTVVHSIGGWVALAGVIVIGPRIGKFNEDGSVNLIHGHSYALATLGALILWVGWIGFNGGSTTVGDPSFASIIANTMIAATFGGAVSTVIGRYQEGLFRPDRSINGVLGGLVAITAGCDVLTVHGAMVVGISAGLVVYYSAWIMEHKFKLDDAVGAVAVHGFCGAWGTILLAFLMPASALVAESRFDQILIQIEGVAVAFVWAFGLAFAAFKIMQKTIGLRVSAEHEVEGLNSAEHGTTLGTGLLQRHLKDIVFGEGDLTKRLDATTGDESAEVAFLFNQFMGRIQNLVRDIGSSTTGLLKVSKTLSSVADDMGRFSDNLSNQSERVARTTVSVSDRMGSSSNVLGGISGEIGDISTHVTEVSTSLTGMAQTVSELQQAVSDIAQRAVETSNVSKRATQMTTQATNAVKSLNKATDQIESLIQLIRDVAEKTNLLALNATIEAAKASEAGKGFAVVAGEVKDLARQTARATQHIEDHIQLIQSDSSNVEDMIVQVSEVMHQISRSIEGISQATQVQGVAAQEISASAQDAMHRSQTIAQSVAGVSDASRHISHDIENVVEDTGGMSAAAHDLSHRAHETSQNARNVEEKASDLTQIGEALTEHVKRFKV